MKWSHVLVAILFFLLGALSVYVGIERPCQKVDLKASTSGTSIGIALGVQTGKPPVAQAKAPSPAISGPAKISFRIEKAVNRHGSDYRDFEMAAKDGYEVCQKACEEDATCKAFTFVKGGVQGTAPHCWLKNTVPQAYPDDACISGVRE